MIENYLNNVGELVLQYGYWIIIIGVMLENIIIIGFFFPGIFILISAGFYSGMGHLNVYYTILVAFLGTILGDNMSYLAGRYGLIKFSKVQSLFGRAEELKTRLQSNKGKILLIFFHFPIYARMIVPTLLGIMKYNFKRWILFNTIGALLFSSTFITVGCIIGRTTKVFDKAIGISSYIQWVFFFLILFFIAIEVIRFYRTRSKK